MSHSIRFAAVLTFLALAPVWANLDAARAEPKLEKRADLALLNAQQALKAAQDGYLAQQDMKLVSASFQEVSDSVQLAYESLVGTHKVPNKSPKYFKKAEIQTRELLRRMNDLRDQMSVDDRDVIDRTRAAVQKVHDSLLEGIMGGKRRE